MTSDDAYAALLAHLKETHALQQVARLLSWDQEAMMPAKGAEARAEQAGAMSAVLHARRTDPRIPDWIAAIDEDALDAAGRANLREAARDHDRATRLPARLAQELAETTMRAHGQWAEARAASDFAAFAPVLTRVIELVREQAACLRGEGQSLYDALLEDFEPGATEEDIAAIFGRLRAGLTDLRARVAETSRQPPVLQGAFAKDRQLSLATDLAALFGYDFQAGRLDLVVHPFCSGTRGDTRITTRVDEADPFNCLYSTIHETGHALYEQGLDPELAGQAAGDHASMGVHESQSRLAENQIGRSRAFMEVLFPRMRAAFGDFGVNDPEGLYRAVNQVRPGFIRTEADEIHYNLHIMLRFELERALIGDDLQVADLEAAWNERFEADFGVPVTDAADGVLQDVHWSAGLFGYFPTYSLGNVYAAELFAAMQGALPDANTLISEGNLAPLIAWLRQHVHARGRLDTPKQIIAEAVGHAPTEAPLLAYLEEKFSTLAA